MDRQLVAAVAKISAAVAAAEVAHAIRRREIGRLELGTWQQVGLTVGLSVLSWYTARRLVRGL